MKKTNNLNKIYSPLSVREAELLSAIDKFTVFTQSIIKRCTGWNSSIISNTLTSLKKKKIVVAVKKNNYVLLSTLPENIFEIATTIISPSYISFWTACSYYGFTEQQVKTIQVVSTKQFPKIKLGNYNLETITFNSKKFFGYIKLNGFVIADKEKLLVDILDKPELAGGINEVKKSLQSSWKVINQDKLFEYLEKNKTLSCFARLGFLLEELGLQHKLTQKIKRNLPQGYVKLNPAREKINKYNQKWMVIINDQ